MPAGIRVTSDPRTSESSDDAANRTAVMPSDNSPRPTPMPAVATAPDQPGIAIGAYRLLRLLGSGGMGAVWLAERQDGQFTKQVALKLLHVGLADAELRARFVQERQILASLQHPNIAALFDGGMSADGRPFFAMEFVDGRAITHYCDQEHLDVRDRVRLFLQVLKAAAHAHQRLIVHRDLKPSNVMVSGERVVKLLDFGIAKLLLHPSHAVVTQIGERAMTPRYAAPEQVRGEPVTVATDVYALGVTLFEMLTGRTPYQSRSGRTHTVEEAILTVEPCRPGLSLSPGSEPQQLDPAREAFELGIDLQRLRRELSGDLELIVLKALRKDAEQRYPSAEAFSADLQRYLDGRPIQARPPSWRYRSGKWLRRNALAAALGSVSIVLLVSGLLFVNAQREHVTAAAARAEATQDFLIDLFEEAGPDRGGSVNASVREILASGAARAEQGLSQQDELRHHLAGLIGRLMNDVGDFDRAEPVLRRAVAGMTGQALNHPDRLSAHAQLAVALGRTGRHDEAQLHWQTVLAAAPALSTERADGHSGLGGLLAMLNRFDEANRQHDAAIAIWRQLGADQVTGLASALIGSAFALDYSDQPEVAARRLQEAVGLLQALPAQPTTTLGRALYQLGMTERTLGHLVDARGHLEDAITLLGGSLGNDHADTLQARRLLGDVLEEVGDQTASHALLTQVLQDAIRRYGDQSMISAEVANSLASIDLARGRYVAAERGFRLVAEVLAREYGEQHAETSVALANLANALFEQGRLEESTQASQRSLDALLASGVDTSDYALTLIALSRTHRAMGNLETALSQAEQASAILSAVYGETHGQTLRATHYIAAIMLDHEAAGSRDVAMVETLLAHVEQHLELESRRGRRLRMEVLTDQGRLLVLQGQQAAAQTKLLEALAIGASEYPEGDRAISAAALELADLQLRRGQQRAARASLERAETSNPNRQPLSAHSRALRDRLNLALRPSAAR